jgi:hypothetical protein
MLQCLQLQKSLTLQCFNVFNFKNPGRFNASTLQLQKSWTLQCFNASASKILDASLLQRFSFKNEDGFNASVHSSYV